MKKLFLNQTNFSNLVGAKASELTRMINKITGVNKDITESSFANTFIVNGDSMGFAYADTDQPIAIIKSFLYAVTTYLSKQKIANEEEAVAFIFSDTAGNFKFGAYVFYVVNENEDTGSWKYAMTLNKEDIDELDRDLKLKKLTYDEEFKIIYRDESYDKGSIEFPKETFMHDSIILIIDSLVQVLDSIAVEGEQVDIEMPELMIATVETKNDVKELSITPGSRLKEIIKNYDIDVAE